MKSNGETPKTIDEYISQWPAEIKTRLETMRETIQKAAPKATEAISYGMPTFNLNGYLVYFAAYKNHIGFYPIPTGLKAFEKELTNFKRGKGSVQFPHESPLPLSLVTKIVKFRAQENAAKAALKKKKTGR